MSVTSAIALVLTLTAALGPQITLPVPERPYLVVQAVDPLWLPIPGIQIRMRERRGLRVTHSALTDRDGLARFYIAPPDSQHSFDVSAAMQGFKTATMKNVRFGDCRRITPGAEALSADTECATPRHIQIRLEPSGPFEIVY